MENKGRVGTSTPSVIILYVSLQKKASRKRKAKTYKEGQGREGSAFEPVSEEESYPLPFNVTKSLQLKLIL